MQQKFQLDQIVNLRLLPDKAVIGNQTFTSDATKAFIEFKFIHSYPKMNSNGMTFFLPLMAKSVGTAQYQPLSQEHQMEGNPDDVYDGKDLIMGTMIMAHIEGIEEFGDEIPLIPDSSIPMKIIGVLWKRKAIVRDMIEDIENGVKWRVSMEVIRDAARDALVVGKEVVRNGEEKYESLMKAWNESRFYDGMPIGLALGGTGLEEDDSLNFWGGTMTLRPADKGATIDRMVAIASDGQITVEKKKRGTQVAKDTEKISITSSGSFRKTNLVVDGKAIKGIRSLSLWAGDRGEDDYFELRWTIEERDGDVVKTIDYQFDPETGEITKGEQTMDLNELKSLLAELKKEGWMTKEEVEVKEQAVRDEFKDFVSPDDLKQKIEAAVKNDREEKESAERIYAEREAALKAQELEITPERAAKAREFSLDGEGKTAFELYVKTLQSNVDAMKAELEAKKITVNEALLSQIAKCDGVEDSRFQAVVGTAQAIEKKTDHAPAFGFTGPGEDGSEEQNYQYAH